MGFNTFPCNPYPISTEELNSNKANQITIAPFFNAETAYTAGDLVYYNGLIYRCTNDHEGEWDADDFAATTVSNELATLNSGLMIVTEATNLIGLQFRTVNSSDKQVSEENIKADLLANTADLMHRPCAFDIRYSGADVVAIGSRVNAGFGSWIVFDLANIKFYTINNNTWSVTTVSRT